MRFYSDTSNSGTNIETISKFPGMTVDCDGDQITLEFSDPNNYSVLAERIKILHQFVDMDFETILDGQKHTISFKGNRSEVLRLLRAEKVITGAQQAKLARDINQLVEVVLN